MHPDIGVLVAFRDRELGEQPAREVARHLETCPRCARQAEQVAADGELLLAADAPFRSECQPPSRGLERVLCGIREWKRSAANSPPGRIRASHASDACFARPSSMNCRS